LRAGSKSAAKRNQQNESGANKFSGSVATLLIMSPFGLDENVPIRRQLR